MKFQENHLIRYDIVLVTLIKTAPRKYVIKMASQKLSIFKTHLLFLAKPSCAPEQFTKTNRTAASLPLAFQCAFANC